MRCVGAATRQQNESAEHRISPIVFCASLNHFADANMRIRPFPMDPSLLSCCIRRGRATDSNDEVWPASLVDAAGLRLQSFVAQRQPQPVNGESVSVPQTEAPRQIQGWM